MPAPKSPEFRRRAVELARLREKPIAQILARRVAETHPERVTRLLLIGSAVTSLKQETRELQAAVQTLEDPVPTEFAREFQAANIYDSLPEAFFERAVAERLKLPADLEERARRHPGSGRR
jgi:pimeloyl-ACP methyl ester carboxylesterase